MSDDLVRKASMHEGKDYGVGFHSVAGDKKDAMAKAFAINFVNAKLKTVGIGGIDDFHDFEDGIKLAKFIEALSGNRVKVGKRVAITGVRLDNLAVCEYAIQYLHKQIHVKVTITAKEFFECNEKAIIGWITGMERKFPEAPPPPATTASEKPHAEEEAQEEEEDDDDHHHVEAGITVVTSTAQHSAASAVEAVPMNHVRAKKNWGRAKVVKSLVSSLSHMELLSQLRQPKAAAEKGAAPAMTMASLASSKLYHDEKQPSPPPPPLETTASGDVVTDYGVGSPSSKHTTKVNISGPSPFLHAENEKLNPHRNPRSQSTP